MRIHKTLAVLACFVCAGCTPISASGAKADGAQGHLRTHRFEQGEYRRRYMLYTPRSIQRRSGARSLVLVIHGGASTDRGMLKLDQGHWNRLADEHGFYVAYPNAVNKLWDFGEGKTSADLDQRVNDLAYFQRVITDIDDRVGIDRKRVFTTGISRGGQSSYYLACNLPGQIRAVAPVAMSLPEFMVNECRSGPPVGIAIMNGTADPQVPYEGGWITVFRKKRDRVLSTDETTALWIQRNGCDSAAVDVSTRDAVDDRTSVAISSWIGCSGAPVKLYKISNGGHTWPSGVQYLPPRIVGRTTREFAAAAESWAFFSQF